MKNEEINDRLLYLCKFCGRDCHNKTGILYHEKACLKNTSNFYSEDPIELTPENLKLIQSQPRAIQKKQKVWFICKQCGREQHLHSFSIFTDFVCGVCKNKASKLQTHGDENYNNRKKSSRTKLKRYGNSKYNNHDKIKETKRLRYGSETYCNREKAQKTILSKYNNNAQEYYKARNEKTKQTNLERYGTENVNNADWKRKQYKETCLKRYGVSNAVKAKSVKAKKAQTCLSRYGAVSPTQNKDIKEKQVLSKQQSLIGLWKSEDYVLSLSENLKQRFDIVDVRELEEEFSFQLKCKLCSTEFEFHEHEKVSKTNHSRNYCFCPNCRDIHSRSQAELDIEAYLQSLGLKTEHSKKILENKDIDILVPKFNIGIEYDGLYWHNNRISGKFDLAARQGIRLIQIQESEWIYKQDKIKAFLRSTFGIYDREIQASRCGIKEISSKEALEFLMQNSIQDFEEADINVSLCFRSEIVGLASFLKSEDSWYLKNVCFKQDVSVVKGLTKILNYFEQAYFPEKLVVYVDISKFDTDVYIKLDFELKDVIDPSYKCFSSSGKLLSTNTKNSVKLYDYGKHVFEKLYITRRRESI